MFPHLEDLASWDGKLPVELDAAAAVRRQVAIEDFVASMDIMQLHSTHPAGPEHVECDHGELTADHLYFTCKPQQRAFQTYIANAKAIVPQLLSAAGRLHINQPETDHSIV